jgi:YjbE family integral membrane protein
VDSALIGVFAEVLLVNLVLSGDNAVVIGLAARGLEPSARQRAILLGGSFAVALRLALTIPAERLLTVPFLRAGGGFLLIWVAYRLLVADESSESSGDAETIFKAVRLIVLADLTMSLDNILAVAAVAERSEHDVLVLTFGLLLSIPIVLVGGNLVARLMHRVPILVWIGAAILGYTAGELIVKDTIFEDVTAGHPIAQTVFSVLIACAILAVAAIRIHGRTRHESQPHVTPERRLT